jgi:hypothetical protein
MISAAPFFNASSILALLFRHRYRDLPYGCYFKQVDKSMLINGPGCTIFSINSTKILKINSTTNWEVDPFRI